MKTLTKGLKSPQPVLATTEPESVREFWQTTDAYDPLRPSDAYGDQTERDHAALAGAVREGRVPAIQEQTA